jgi:hypothetical protein
MPPDHARTKFVKHVTESRPAGFDRYVEDLLKIERALADSGPRGIAATMAYLNLISRYPRETEAIARELGTTILEPLNEERIDEVLGDRLRLAGERLFHERRVAGEFGDTD